MIRLHVATAAAAFVLVASMTSHAARVGDPAPAFKGTDTKGSSHALSDYKGKFVVLEWHNQGCPYVRKHYGSGNMQRLQKEWTAKGVVWLTIISSAPKMQGYVTAEQADAYVREQQAAPTAVLLDPSGAIGRAYDAKTTPHMFVIDPSGRLVYEGAIDDKPTTDVADVATAQNYVSAALTAAMAGKPVATAATKPYGCSVKYASGS
jgi:peroxiredoxin